ncbi:MAG: hypothetical protein WCF54_08005 [Terracidiphilus sp.]
MLNVEQKESEDKLSYRKIIQPSEICGVNGCVNPRRPGQRNCKEHHAEMQREFREKNKQPEQLIMQAVKASARKIGRRKIDAKFKAQMEALVASVRDKIEVFNLDALQNEEPTGWNGFLKSGEIGEGKR